MGYVSALIFFASGVLSALVVFHFFLKRYMQMHAEMKARHKQHFQELINKVYHKDHIPLTKRVRGLTNLGLPTTLRLLNLLELAKKNHHTGYVKLASEEAINVMEYWRLAQQVSLELEENVIKNVKGFEQYQ